MSQEKLTENLKLAYSSLRDNKKVMKKHRSKMTILSQCNKELMEIIIAGIRELSKNNSYTDIAEMIMGWPKDNKSRQKIYDMLKRYER